MHLDEDAVWGAEDCFFFSNLPVSFSRSSRVCGNIFYVELQLLCESVGLDRDSDQDRKSVV